MSQAASSRKRARFTSSSSNQQPAANAHDQQGHGAGAKAAAPPATIAELQQQNQQLREQAATASTIIQHQREELVAHRQVADYLMSDEGFDQCMTCHNYDDPERPNKYADMQIDDDDFDNRSKPPKLPFDQFRRVVVAMHQQYLHHVVPKRAWDVVGLITQFSAPRIIDFTISKPIVDKSEEQEEAEQGHEDSDDDEASSDEFGEKDIEISNYFVKCPICVQLVCFRCQVHGFRPDTESDFEGPPRCKVCAVI